ncbi:hypothetical protein CCR94_16400 [Rhodoblastus sphagnicola]|uniref:Uncharacterized protein n=1 Tax=Rhodoblastus sphagnicola TaxID=333368 RepID=A0A2S6N2X3_9HYPH|nr:helix-turn-helix domain-containing protein [Rhodoblastus sphagnicola]MBB4199078.1 hypothetical protein [Rhodoblastus sphagnicola]PPQ28971.1 hypothetical protein CCR94_16400 [Rhodoblastus sphagnicola]
MLDFLPPIYREIAEIAGLDAVMKLGAAKGGTRVFIPRPEHCGPEHWLRFAVGEAAAQAICNWRGGEDIVLPVAPQNTPAGRRRLALAALEAGASANEAAAKAGVHVRTIYSYRARDLVKSNQLSLFDD